MITATRNWLRRNRTNFAIGFGVVGAGYVATQYVLTKITEARERRSIDHISRKNLRRRFEQNQEDCTFTVLALLPTATENILESLPVETITHELQQKKAERLARSTASTDIASSELSSGPPSAADEDGRSLGSFQSEGYVHASQLAVDGAKTGESEASKSQPSQRSKAQLWNELKINSITRTLTLIYTLALLTLLTRIQLNLLGRRNYLSSVVSLASPPTPESTISLENHDDDNPDQVYGNDFDTNRRYLTFSWWLLHRGWREIMYKVQAAVREVYGPLNPREDISLAKLSELTLVIRRKVEGEDEAERRAHRWLTYLLPPRSEEDMVLQESGMGDYSPQSAPTTDTSASSPISSATPLRRLLDETSDIIDSPPFSHVLTRLLDAAFSTLIDQRLSSQAFKVPVTTPPIRGAPETRITEVTNPAELKTKLANVLAVMTRQAHAVGNGVPNEYVDAVESVKELEALAAVVYSSNFDYEAARKDDDLGTIAEEGESRGGAGEGAEAGLDESGELVGAESGFESAWGKALEKTVDPVESEPSREARA